MMQPAICSRAGKVVGTFCCTPHQKLKDEQMGLLRGPELRATPASRCGWAG